MVYLINLQLLCTQEYRVSKKDLRPLTPCNWIKTFYFTRALTEQEMLRAMSKKMQFQSMDDAIECRAN